MSNFTFRRKSIVAASAILLSACAGQQVPIPSFPETGVAFGGPTVSIGAPVMVNCPFTRPDGTHFNFETTADLCNELLLSGGGDEADSTRPLSPLEPAAPPSPPAGNALSDGSSSPLEPDRVAETAGGVCSLGKDRVADTFYCDDLVQAQTRVRGVLGPHWNRLSGNRKNLLAIWCYWAQDGCLWHSDIGERIDGGHWLELAGLLMAMLPQEVPQASKDAIGLAVMRDSEIPFPVTPLTP